MTAPTAARLGFELWLFLFVALAGTTLLWTQAELRLAALVIFAVPVLAWAVVRVRRPVELLDAAILAGICAHVVVSLASVDRAGSLEASAIVVVYAAAYWLARHVGTDPVLRRTAAIAVVMALVAWLVVIAGTWVAEKIVDIQAFGWPPRLEAYLPYSWGSVNTPPVLVLLVAPFVAWLPDRRVRRVLAGVLVLVAAVVIPFSVGRAAWLGFAVAGLALAVMFAVPMIRSRRAAAAVSAGVASVGALGALLLATRMDAVVGALDSRIRLWQQAAGLFTADPITGSGPGTFSWARLSHVPEFTDRVGATAAHSVPMHTLAEGGLLLAGALGFVVVAWAWQAGVGRRRLGFRQRLAIAVLLGFGAFALLDDLSFLPTVTILVITLAAWSLPARVSPPPGVVSGSRSLVLPAVLVIATIVSAPAAVSLGLMRVDAARARQAAVAGDWNDALEGFRAAASAQPSSALHWMGVGLAEHHLGRDSAAVEAYRAAVSASPGDARPWGALGALAATDDALGLLREAARRSNDPQYAYRLAIALTARGRTAEAAEWYATASVIRPELYAAIPAPMRAGVRAELPAAIERVGSVAGRDPTEALWNAALAAGELHADAPAAWSVARALDEGDTESAAAALREAQLQQPRSPRTWQAASALAVLSCDSSAQAEAEMNLERLGADHVVIDHQVIERRPGLYREPELGDYQPLSAPTLVLLPPWPDGLIRSPDCG